MIQFSDKENGVAVAGSVVAFTHDGGKHWQTSVVDSVTAITPVVSLQLRGLQAWTGGKDGEILHSVDGGKRWKETAGSRDLWSTAGSFGGGWGSVFFTSSMVGYTLRGTGLLYETHDGGIGWSRATIPNDATDLTCSPDQCWLLSKNRIYRIDQQ